MTHRASPPDSSPGVAGAVTAPKWRRVPGSRRMVVAPDSRRSARHLRSLAASSDWRRDLVDRAGMTALGLLGAQALPVAPPLDWPRLSYDELAGALRSVLPGLHPIGLVSPRQSGRRRLSMLARLTGNAVVIKLGDGDDRLEREAEALDLLAAHPLPGIATPAPIAVGRLLLPGAAESSTYLVTTSVSLGRQRPAIDAPLRTFERDLAIRLSSLPRPSSDVARRVALADGASELVPVHGDLTPWNLRRTSHGLALFDWESAGWGAAGSDVATYRHACDSVRPWWTLRRQHAPLSSPVTPAPLVTRVTESGD